MKSFKQTNKNKKQFQRNIDFKYVKNGLSLKTLFIFLQDIVLNIEHLFGQITGFYFLIFILGAFLEQNTKSHTTAFIILK